MLDDDDEQTQQEEEVVKTAKWSSKSFERPTEDDVVLKRFTYSKGIFQPEHGPHYIANIFANENHLTLNAICAEIAMILKEDEENMRNITSPRTLVCCIMPSSKFDFIELHKRQGNFYQYTLMGKYTLITKVLWHSTRDLMNLEMQIMDLLRENSTAFAYVNYLHSDNLGAQI